jgi:hypothetical protein
MGIGPTVVKRLAAELPAATEGSEKIPGFLPSNVLLLGVPEHLPLGSRSPIGLDG